MKKRILAILLIMCTMFSTFVYADNVDLATYSIEIFSDIDYSTPEALRIALSRTRLTRIVNGRVEGGEWGDARFAYPNATIRGFHMLEVLGMIMGSNEADVIESDLSIWGCNFDVEPTEEFLIELHHLCHYDYFPEFLVSFGNSDYNLNNPETFNHELWYKKFKEPLQLKWAVVPLVQLAGYEETAMQNGGFFDGYFKTAVDMGLFKNTRFEAYGSQILNHQNDTFTRGDMAVMVDNALNMPMYGVDYNGYKHYRNYGLDKPVLKDATIELKVGEKPYFSWYDVENANYYTVWDWTRENVYHQSNTYIDNFPPYTEPGTYAVGIYARSSDKSHLYPQSEPINFNVVVKPDDGSFSPTPQQGNYNLGDVINEAVHTDITAYVYSHYIPSYNIDGYTAVIAEDLIYYGLNVEYDNNTRSLYINKGDKVVTTEYKVAENTAPIGSKYMDVLYTDIKTYVDGKEVRSYNIGGRTAVFIDDLAPFGTVEWSEQFRMIALMR